MYGTKATEIDWPWLNLNLELSKDEKKNQPSELTTAAATVAVSAYIFLVKITKLCCHWIKSKTIIAANKEYWHSKQYNLLFVVCFFTYIVKYPDAEHSFPQQ